MTGYCQYALKEWPVTIHSLVTGRQTLLLRKGGIRDQRDGFEVKHQGFFLFPTYLHQSVDALHPSFRSPFGSDLGARPPTLVLDTFGEVQELIPISSLEILRRLDGLHTLNWTAVEQRFSYRNRPGVDLLLLRIYRLPVVHRIQNMKQYDGCVSWVELEESLSIAGGEPVLTDPVFERQVKMIRSLADPQHRLTCQY